VSLPFRFGSAPHASSRLTKLTSPWAAAQVSGRAYELQLFPVIRPCQPRRVGLEGCPYHIQKLYGVVWGIRTSVR
jgi:hypothetical protein